MNHNGYHILFLFQVLAISKLAANMQVTPTYMSVCNSPNEPGTHFCDAQIKTPVGIIE